MQSPGTADYGCYATGVLRGGYRECTVDFCVRRRQDGKLKMYAGHR